MPAVKCKRWQESVWLWVKHTLYFSDCTSQMVNPSRGSATCSFWIQFRIVFKTRSKNARNSSFEHWGNVSFFLFSAFNVAVTTLGPERTDSPWLRQPTKASLATAPKCSSQAELPSKLFWTTASHHPTAEAALSFWTGSQVLLKSP